MGASASSRVAICKVDGQYPLSAPFDPDQEFPEHRGRAVGSEPNPVYRGVRETFRMLGCDAAHFGTPAWNPFGHIIKPGQRVFIKPNLVTHEYRASCGCNGDIFSVITHPSVVRAVADYVALALQGRGEIVIGDNPCIDADFDKILAATQLCEFERLYPERFGIRCRVLDLRPRCTRDLRFYGFKSKTDKLPGDPEGSSVLDLREQSRFYGLNPLLFRGVFTNRWETILHHHGRRHEYSISNTILNSDVYISVPKLKAHHKVGATLNIKGLVGVNANKNYLVHWRIGFPRLGGDEFPVAHRAVDYGLHAIRHFLEDFLPESLYVRLYSRLDRALRLKQKSSHEKHRGAWDGNDTCWRMAADLYRAFVQDAAGWREARDRQMRFFSVVDGVLAGEGNGPFCPDGKRAQVVIAGADLLDVDCVAARLMDYDVRLIRYLNDLLCENEADLQAIEVLSDDFDVTDFFSGGARYLQFAPPSGWPRLALAPESKEAIRESHYSCCG